MSHLDICRAQLPLDEGRKDKPYKDTEGIITIGIGRNLEKGLRPDEIDYLFSNDLRDAEAAAKAVFANFDALSEARKAVLCNMAFNLGQTRLAAFQKFLAALSAGDYEQAASEMLASRWAVQTGARAQRLAKQMREG